MNKINHIYLVTKGALLIVMLMCVNSQTFADQALGYGIDCSDVSINYIDRPDMTRSERLEAMNRAFFESVNRFELCNLSNQTSSSSASASAAEQARGSESETRMTGSDNNEDEMAAVTEGSETGFDSVASSAMSGTETKTESPSAAFEFPEDSGMPENDNEETVANYGGGGSNGAVPEDIPDANNDDVVASQIRIAAEFEKDLIKKEKLWNEYRKYKGLPVKKSTKDSVNVLAKDDVKNPVKDNE